MSKRTEGWGSLDNAPGNAHYFGSDGRSLCRRWLAFNMPRWETNQSLGPEPKRNSGTCKACWTKVKKLHEKSPPLSKGGEG